MEPLDKIKDLIDSMQLPELKEDLDSFPIEREHFKSYHEYLEKHLPILYDCIQLQPENFIWSGKEMEISKQEMRASLIVLLCEIASSNSIFKLNQIELLNNAERILRSCRSVSSEVDNLIFKYYEDKLCKDRWKRQLGAVHGFVKYLEDRFSSACDLNKEMGQKLIMFCLSVALNVRSCYETHYKELSTTIFLTVLRQENKYDIISMNVHGVIYDAVFKDINILNSTCLIGKQWNCLIKCLDFYENYDSFTWNNLDDMMEVLLRNISLSPDSDTSICHLKFVNKLVVYFTIDHKEFDDFYGKELTLVENRNVCRSIANSNTSYTCYRWAKNILQMFIVESYKLLQAKDITTAMLQEIHKIYVLAILPIPLSVVEPHLIKFFDKFIAVLMETLKVHKHEEDIAMVITLLLETFCFHLESSNGSAKLNNFKQNIYALLKTDFFEMCIKR